MSLYEAVNSHEDEVRRIEAELRGSNSVLAEKVGLDPELLSFLLGKITVSENDIIAHQLKPLLSSARLIYSDEASEHMTRISDRRKGLREKLLRIKTTLEQKKEREGQRLRRNGLTGDENAKNMTIHVAKFCRRYSVPFPWLAMSEDDKQLFQFLKDEKLIQVKNSGLFGRFVEIIGDAPPVSANDRTFKFLTWRGFDMVS